MVTRALGHHPQVAAGRIRLHHVDHAPPAGLGQRPHPFPAGPAPPDRPAPQHDDGDEQDGQHEADDLQDRAPGDPAPRVRTRRGRGHPAAPAGAALPADAFGAVSVPAFAFTFAAVVGDVVGAVVAVLSAVAGEAVADASRTLFAGSGACR